ncbi:hypothetical protein ACSBOB_30815 [Mesorhizobium sp. ASY16-5R]|uniref:hypothetical protein n=1 Tax=Mesorhizobium sp. ASY16-5R TaxID=3445772 RepID=UPI003FA037CC
MWRSKRIGILNGFILALGLSAATAPAVAKDLVAKPLACSGDGLFDWSAHKDDDNAPANNISGIDCEATGQGWHCVAVADEEVSITLFDLQRGDNGGLACVPGRQFSSASTNPDHDFDCFGSDSNKERDFEGVTLDKGAIVATGSWGMSRKKAELRPRNWTVYKKEKDDGSDCVRRKRGDLKAIVESAHEPVLDGAVDRSLQCGGLNIEGLTKHSGGYLFGLRSPADREGGVAYVLNASEKVVFDGPDQDNRASLHAIAFAGADGKPVEGIGIRGLDEIGGKVVILTGNAGVDGASDALAVSLQPENGCQDAMQADPPYPNRELAGLAPMLWSWVPGEASAKLIGKVGGDSATRKLEGVAVLERPDGKTDIVLAIDSPNETDGPLAVISDLTIP